MEAVNESLTWEQIKHKQGVYTPLYHPNIRLIVQTEYSPSEQEERNTEIYAMHLKGLDKYRIMDIPPGHSWEYHKFRKTNEKVALIKEE